MLTEITNRIMIAFIIILIIVVGDQILIMFQKKLKKMKKKSLKKLFKEGPSLKIKLSNIIKNNFNFIIYLMDKILKFL